MTVSADRRVTDLDMTRVTHVRGEASSFRRVQGAAAEKRQAKEAKRSNLREIKRQKPSLVRGNQSKDDVTKKQLDVSDLAENGYGDPNSAPTMLTNVPSTKLDAGSLKSAVALVESLEEIPNDVRLAVMQALKRRLKETDGSPQAPDLSNWRPPEAYLDRHETQNLGRKENIIEFLGRVWEPWTNQGCLPLATIKELDPPAYRAIFSWRKKGHEVPDHLNLVTRNDLVDQRIQRELALPRGERSVRTEWALLHRRYRAPKKVNAL